MQPNLANDLGVEEEQDGERHDEREREDTGHEQPGALVVGQVVEGARRQERLCNQMIRISRGPLSSCGETVGILKIGWFLPPC